MSKDVEKAIKKIEEGKDLKQVIRLKRGLFGWLLSQWWRILIAYIILYWVLAQNFGLAFLVAIAIDIMVYFIQLNKYQKEYKIKFKL